MCAYGLLTWSSNAVSCSRLFMSLNCHLELLTLTIQVANEMRSVLYTTRNICKRKWLGKKGKLV